MIGLTLDEFLNIIDAISHKIVRSISGANGYLYAIEKDNRIVWRYKDRLAKSYINYIIFKKRIVTYIHSSLGYPTNLSFDTVREIIEKNSFPIEPYVEQCRKGLDISTYCLTSPLERAIYMESILPDSNPELYNAFSQILIKRFPYLVIYTNTKSIAGNGHTIEALNTYIKSLDEHFFLREGTVVAYDQSVFPLPPGYKILRIDRVSSVISKYIRIYKNNGLKDIGIDGVASSNMVIKSGIPIVPSEFKVFKVYGQYSDEFDALCLFPTPPYWRKEIKRDPYILVIPLWYKSIKDKSALIPSMTSSWIYQAWKYPRERGFYDIKIVTIL